MSMYTYGVVATKNRHSMVRDLLKSLVGQVDRFFVVDNNDQPDSYEDVHPLWVRRIHQPGYPPNFSALYNTGIRAARTDAPTGVEYNVAILNDDVICPPGWVDSLDRALRSTTAQLAYTDRMGRPEPELYQRPPYGQHEAATIWACLLRGESGLEFDETMRWWYSDNDLDLRCRRAGGTIAVPGPIPRHLHPGVQTNSDVELSAQAHRDAVVYDTKWAGVQW
jgi:GT2 family glycosyltransferase